MTRITLALVAIVCCAALTAPAAAAAIVEYVPGHRDGPPVLRYAAAPGEVNAIDLAGAGYVGSPSEAGFYLSESTAPLAWPADCERLPAPGTQITCARRGVALVEVDLGDAADRAVIGVNGGMHVPAVVTGGAGDDRLSAWGSIGDLLDGGSGNDVIDSGGGPDLIIGADGDDVIDATIGDKSIQTVPGGDRLSCGAGRDSVLADATDEVAADCEHVTLAAGPGGPMSRADGQPIGVSIEGGARFTNSPDVTLTVLAPDAATHLLVSDDGGFREAVRLAVDRGTNAYPMRLPETGQERLPKIAYVRFVGRDIDPGATVSDDIVLDQTPPTAVSARIAGRTRACAASRRSCFRVVVRARDGASGVARMQLARFQRRPSPSIAFRSPVLSAYAPRWVRVRDRAGNVSRWRAVRWTLRG